MRLVEKHRRQAGAEAELPAAGTREARMIAAFEVASVMISVIVAAWVILPLQPERPWLALIPAIAGLALILRSQLVRGETARSLGLGTVNFLRAAQLLALPMLAGAALIVAIGMVTGSFHYTSHFRIVLLGLPIWGLIQQYVVQGFVYRRLRYSFAGRGNGIAIAATAVLFALAHAPNLMLMSLTLVGGIVWTWVYDRAPNLLALGLSHAIMSLLIMTSWPPWLLDSMGTGFKYFFRQRLW
jgi:membrane protease YdiL (CAAX protease family)